jgi:hypothetical protein
MVMVGLQARLSLQMAFPYGILHHQKHRMRGLTIKLLSDGPERLSNSNIRTTHMVLSQQTYP